MKKKAYISGPITKVPREKAVRSFSDAEKRLIQKGYTPINPLDNGLPVNAPWEDHMREDLKMMMDCDTIYMLKGFRKSRGAMIEYTLAKELNMNVILQVL